MGGKVEGNEDRLLAFARYTAALHQAGILHLDYSPGNILIHHNEIDGYSFSLVDVNRMQLLTILIVILYVAICVVCVHHKRLWLI